VAGKEPWTPGQAGAPAQAQAPALAGTRLTYWRRHQALANWVQVTVDTTTGSVQAVLDSDLTKPTGSLVDRARIALTAPTLPERQGAIRDLAASDDPGAITLLLDTARNNDAWKIRQEAVRQLGERARPGAVATLIDALGADPQAEVRGTAATALGKLGDKAAKDALTRASTADADAAVKAAAAGALARLR
jgi:hypothetical protein